MPSSKKMRAVLLLMAVQCLRADDLTQKFIARLTEEAEAFQRLAPQVLGQETLLQRAQKPPRRFRIRVGAAARTNTPEWQQRRIVSEYGYTTFAGDTAVHELRQVVSVDGRDIAQKGKALDAVIATHDDGRKRELLKQFEEHGLLGAASDFSQMILLFTSRGVSQYEFQFLRRDVLQGEPAQVFGYRQVDGRNLLTVVDTRKGETRNLSVQGEIWAREGTLLPLRITLAVTHTLGEEGVREEAEVDYAMSPFGAVLPTAVRHRDLRGARLLAENTFAYSDFHRFGASSDIVFEADPDAK
jgi:hypothetical protein